LSANARANPGIELQPRLIRGGEVVWAGKPIAVLLQPGMDARRILGGGMLTLRVNTTPGEYGLELTAVNLGSKRELFVQSVNFDFH
jgi:hypothetical protein